MFTPPPSPLPFPTSAEESSSSSPHSPTTTPESSEYPFPRVASSKAPSAAEASPHRTPIDPIDLKKRSGHRTLLLVTLLPVALLVSAFLRHFVRMPPPVVFEEYSPVPIVKRGPQLLTGSGLPTPSSSGFPSLSSSDSQSSFSLPSPSASSTVPTIPTAPTLPTPFPQPFDVGLSDNFTTTGCQAFFANFTQDENFRQCRSFSFLLNASAAFLQAQRNLSLMNDIIWGTCNTPPTIQTCDSIMSNYLSELTSVCQKDISQENPVVTQAQISFQSYTAMRIAGCLPDASTNAFCYIDAVATFPPTDIYFYALPLGTPVPNTTKPSCSPCVKSVLAVYAQYTNPSSGSGAVQIGAESGNSSASALQPSPIPVLSQTYPAAARLAVNQCGGTYASIGVAQSSGAEQNVISRAAIILCLLLVSWTY